VIHLLVHTLLDHSIGWMSPDLLDSEYASIDHVRAVANIGGVTQIGQVDAAGRAIVDKGLMSLAELHRSGQLRPEAEGRGR
jgi:hypothetical protein